MTLDENNLSGSLYVTQAEMGALADLINKCSFPGFVGMLMDLLRRDECFTGETQAELNFRKYMLTSLEATCAYVGLHFEKTETDT